MKLQEVRSKYIHFFSDGGNHAVIPSSPLIPENDPTTLFTGSGMQPLVPYLLGEPHPSGKRLVNSQKSFRSEDIEEVGDNRHTTFFEMLGNWSLGDYFKEVQLPGIFRFLVDEVKLDPKKLYVTVFSGEKKYSIPRDEESVAIWKDLFSKEGIRAVDIDLGSLENASENGMQNGRIFYYNARKNWWSRAGIPEKMPEGEPGGPDSEIFYDFETPHDSKFGAMCHPNCDCGRFMEIGNSVFMEYKKTEKGFEKLQQRNVDFGGGLERITSASNNNPDVFQIDVFSKLIIKIEELSGKFYTDKKYIKSFRIVADHLRAAVFIIGDGVTPSNVERGYFVRRLLRRAIRHLDILCLGKSLSELVGVVIDSYEDYFSEIKNSKKEIELMIQDEEARFRKTLDAGLREFNRIADKYSENNVTEVSGKEAFVLFSSHGLPIDIISELAAEHLPRALSVNIFDFEEEFKKHQEISRVGTEKKFKGGLSDTSDMSVKYHTATHLLHQALRDVLGNHVGQKGSNITPERLRFDFTHTGKMTQEQIDKVEQIVNQKILSKLPVQVINLPKKEAEESGALHFFAEKYGDMVTVHFIGDTLDSAYSKEFCGGPHVKNTETLGVFKILKEEAVSSGVRRIKAILK